MPTVLQPNFDASLHQMVQAIVTVLAVINPVVCGSIFLTLTPKLSTATTRRRPTSPSSPITTRRVVHLLHAGFLDAPVLAARLAQHGLVLRRQHGNIGLVLA